ncbi:hypothetical protein FOZ63_006611 [Perkinsus olseni]|uniref:Uncharacterized protein n=1 Tax=Perkinsus olseni TaxID=32597 RepID=A0A7J6RFI3_PEROL|nr:hypothetical protein FOZ62_025331 [Perkinsus olseni]KAF4754040.1 hypothetical protein FOZ63_006611 [Perkinsus olseni]
MVAFSLIFTSALSSAVALQSALQHGGRQVELAPYGDQCSSRRPDTFLNVLQSFAFPGKTIFWKETTSDNSFTYWTNGEEAEITYVKGGVLKGVAKGRTVHIDRVFAKVFPFAHLKDRIFSNIPITRGYGQCETLIDLIETTPPKGYEGKSDWIKSFVNGNMAAAFDLAKTHGSFKDYS